MSTIIIGDRIVQSGDSGYQPQGVNRPTQQQQKDYQQMAQSMADAGIRSLSGRTTSTPQGAEARDIQRDFLVDRRDDVEGAGMAEGIFLDRMDFPGGSTFSGELGAGNILETEGDPLKRSIVSNILRGKQPRETGIFGIDFSNVGLPAVGPALGFIQGLQGKNTLLKNLKTGNLTDKDRIVLANLLALEKNQGKDFISSEGIEANEELFTSLKKSFEPIDLITTYIDRYMGGKPEGLDTIKSMFGDLTGTDDKEFNIIKEDKGGFYEGEYYDDEFAKGELVPTLEKVKSIIKPEGMAYLKATDPKTYYKIFTPQTSADIEELAGQVMSTGKTAEDRRYNAKIMEARALTADKQSRQDVNMAQASPAFAPPTAPAPGTPAPPPAPPIFPGFPGTPTPGLPIPGTPTRPVVTNYSNMPTYTQGGVQTFLTDPRFAQFRDTLNLFPRV